MAKIIGGHVVGTGSAINVSLGFVPDYVEITNETDGDRLDFWFRGRSIAFTSGGTTALAAGDLLVGATSGATARIEAITLTSGSWAAGDAAGFIFFNDDDKTGTLTTEAAYARGNSAGSLDQASIVVDVDFEQVITTAVAAGTPSATLTHYAGSTTAAKGFTIGATTSESGKLLRYKAEQWDRNINPN